MADKAAFFLFRLKIFIFHCPEICFFYCSNKTGVTGSNLRGGYSFYPQDLLKKKELNQLELELKFRLDLVGNSG